MKRTIILIAIVTLAVIGSYIVFAEESMGSGMMGGGMMRRGMMGNMQGRGMMMDYMGSMMNSSSLVATSDGGVVVLMGNELSKYDSELNLVKSRRSKIRLRKLAKNDDAAS